MNNREEYLFWRLAHFFISNQGYRIIQLFENQRELWLEKLENKKSPIVRLIRQELNWSNAMQRDIEFSSINGERIRKQLGRGELTITNIYISPFPPVDDYQFRLEKPFSHPDGNKTTVQSFLVTSGEISSGLTQLSDWVDTEISIPLEESYSDQAVELQRKAALEHAIHKAKEERAILSQGKPFFTYVFMIVQAVVFIWLEMNGGSTNTSTLIKYGAKFNPYIIAGEWWRFITPIFLHIGLLHLAMNSLAVYYLGTAVEKIYGNIRFLFIYLFAGVAGVIASFIVSANVSAGASGAIFGCFGALLYFCMIYPKLFFRTMGPSVLVILVINLMFGFSVSNVDNAGHLGGLAGGFLAAGIVHFPKKKKLALQFLFTISSAAIIWGSLTYGFTHSASSKDESANFMLAQEYVKQEEYQKAYDVLVEIEPNIFEPSSQLYFLLSFVEIKLRMLPDAKNHLLKVIELEPDLSEAYYNLALILLEEKDLQQAKSYAEKAANLNPEKHEYSDIVDEINRMLQSSGGGV